MPIAYFMFKHIFEENSAAFLSSKILAISCSKRSSYLCVSEQMRALNIHRVVVELLYCLR